MKSIRRIVIPFTWVCLLAGMVWLPRVSAQEPKWHPPQRLELAPLRQKIDAARQAKESWLSQPAVLAYKAACFFATGKLDAPAPGTRQAVRVEFPNGEEDLGAATATVEFLGYADDSLNGERFSLELRRGEDGTWAVTRVERAAYGRGDAR